MLHKAFSLYDVKGLTFSPPFFMLTDGLATRAFGDLVGDRGTMVGRHPRDYQLFHVGEFDDRSGLLAASQPRLVIDGAGMLEVLGLNVSAALQPALPGFPGAHSSEV